MLSRITYAISCFRQRINALLERARKFGFTTETLYCVEDLLEKSDTRLFTRLKALHIAFIPSYPGNNKSCQLFFRKRGHTFTLPHCCYKLCKNCFVPRCPFVSYNVPVLCFILCFCVLYYVLLCLTYKTSYVLYYDE